MKKSPTVTKVMRKVAKMSETLYPGFTHAEIIVHVRPELPNVVLPVTRTFLFLRERKK